MFYMSVLHGHFLVLVMEAHFLHLGASADTTESKKVIMRMKAQLLVQVMT